MTTKTAADALAVTNSNTGTVDNSLNDDFLRTVFPITSLTNTDEGSNLSKWYLAWFKRQIDALPSLVTDKCPDIGELLIPVAFFFKAGKSLDDVAEFVLGHFTDEEDEASRDLAKTISFAILGWQTMLYLPSINTCPLGNFAVADVFDGHTIPAFWAIRQDSSLTHLPIPDFLLGFGLMLPQGNVFISEDTEDCQNFDRMTMQYDNMDFGQGPGGLPLQVTTTPAMPPRIPTSLVSRPTTTTPPSALLLAACRAFTTTTPFEAKHSSSKQKLDQLLAKAPAYPYPIKTTFKQSWFGLYASKHVQFGNNIPNKKYTITRRRWYPNIKHKKLWSFGLGEWVTCKLATSVLRTIDKVGGLDNYLLSEKPARLKELGPWGWELRYRLQTSKTVQRKYNEERLKMGLITKEKMVTENVKLGVAQGVQEALPTYKQRRLKRQDIPKGFAERWKKSAKVKKVLFGEPWRVRRYVGREAGSERRAKTEADNARVRRAEAVMARQKQANQERKKIEKEEKKRQEEEQLLKLAEAQAARRGGPTPSAQTATDSPNPTVSA
ncbi:39S ribosomal protein L24, mitochondrial [Orbilia oligospora]|uniref:39S ribosomal protein L24, mitochondrial n=2 Tax=Orbilia oligospora TaxID=2813651 RepID=A0A7C8QSA4_ORBOL|nr:39S ribosomal protein L24, mitochondrial [Orbilia oligospora]